MHLRQDNTYDINAYRRRKKLIRFRNRFLALISALTLIAAVLVGIYFYQNYDLDQLAESGKTVVCDNGRVSAIFQILMRPGDKLINI